MLTWPVEYLRPTKMLWRRANVADSDRAVNGRRFSRVTDGGGGWSCRMTVPLTNGDKVRTALSLVELADGGAAPFIVPVLDVGFQPYVDGVETEASFGDGSTFSDGGLLLSPGIKVALAADAAERATSITVRVDVAAAFKGFEAFSFDHPNEGRRVYAALACQDLGGGLMQIEVRPPFREAVTAMVGGVDTLPDFDTPSCVMTLTNADDCLAFLERSRTVKSSLDLVFEEYFE